MSETFLKLEREPTKPYCVPWEAGLGSTEKAVASSLGKILTTLSDLDHRTQGPIEDHLREVRIFLHNALVDDGWRIKAKQTGGWRVLPPKRG